MTYLDTHVVVWLYANGGEKLSETAKQAIEQSDDLRISPMVMLELDYLHEIGRINVGSQEIFSYLHHQIGLKLCDRPFAALVEKAASQTWTRDPFDRLIVAQAGLADDALISKDRYIHDHYPYSVW